ncbi:MAG: hypothetical protein BWY20_02474 [Spirochaetes bacterium ADurb.Bin215]|nr:MAG: hypothetical protein BWY20_02474 [Spirochaetes bacterium ADurb.Bin215]
MKAFIRFYGHECVCCGEIGETVRIHRNDIISVQCTEQGKVFGAESRLVVGIQVFDFVCSRRVRLKIGIMP